MSAVQLKKSLTSIGEVDSSIAPASLILKLSVSNSALRYFVYSTSYHRIIFFAEYGLTDVTDVEDLNQKIEKICKKDEVLQLPFGDVWIGFDGKYSLLPEDLLF